MAITKEEVAKFQNALEDEITTWEWFRYGLRPEDRPYMEKIFTYTRKQAEAGSQGKQIMYTDYLWMATLIAQQKQIETLLLELDALKKSLNL